MSTALFIQRDPRRLSTALLLSLLVHALLLSITLGGQAFGLPGLNFPWKERRLGADDLRIMLAPAPSPSPAPATEPAVTSPTEMTSAAPTTVDKPAVARTVTPLTLPLPAIERSEAAAVFLPPPAPAPTPAPMPVTPTVMRPDVNLPIAPDAPPERALANNDTPIVRTEATEVPVDTNANDVMQKQVEQETRERALEQVRLEQEIQSAEKLRQAEVVANAQREAARQELLRQEAIRAEQTAKIEAARMEADRQERARQETLRREALRQEQARQDEKAQQEAARQELARAEAARMEALRQEATRQEQAKQAQLEAARQAQAQLDAARVEAARKEATRQEQAKQAELEAARQAQAQLEAARQDAVRQEAARRDAMKQEAARQDAAKQDAARQEQARQQLAQKERAEQEAQREERLRAIGEQMKAEAAQRDALNRPSSTSQPTVSSLRRGWLFGRADSNTDLVLYAEAMSKKIEMNMTFDIVREAVKQPHAQPTVTVAIRADGSVEKVTFVVSSGVPAIDEAIRKVVASQAPYGKFPPDLERQYDVIEIRRTWLFDTAIRLQ